MVCVLNLAVFQYPFGLNATIGVIGSIGVSINAAIIILTGLRDNEAAAGGDQSAMVDVVMGSSRHIVSTTITTFGGFLPLILQGGGFWPPFAMAVAGWCVAVHDCVVLLYAPVICPALRGPQDARCQGSAGNFRPHTSESRHKNLS